MSNVSSSNGSVSASPFCAFKPFLTTKLQSVVGNVHALGLAILREHLEIRARPAADIEDRGARGV